jgi:hypothetical protein
LDGLIIPKDQDDAGAVYTGSVATVYLKADTPYGDARSLSKPIDQGGDLIPGVAGDDGFAILDFVRLQVHVYGRTLHGHDESCGVGMRMHAAGFALNQIGRNARTVQLFADVRRNFQFAFIEWRERQPFAPGSSAIRIILAWEASRQMIRRTRTRALAAYANAERTATACHVVVAGVSEVGQPRLLKSWVRQAAHGIAG